MAWTTQYEANELPTAATPAWTKDGDATTIEISPAGFLHVAMVADEGVSWYISDENLSVATGTTIEAKVKIVSADTAEDFFFCISADANWCDLYLLEDRIVLWDGDSLFEEYMMNTTDDYHTYRITQLGTAVKVYVDGVLRINSVCENAFAGDYCVYFGNWSYSGATKEYSLDYLYWSSSGADAPETGRTTAPFPMFFRP